MSPENCPALVLNADFRPLSYLPLSLWPWQEAVNPMDQRSSRLFLVVRQACT